MDEDPDVSQASVLGIGGVPHELGDPRPVGLGADARDLTAAAGQVHQDPLPMTSAGRLWPFGVRGMLSGKDRHD